MSSMGSPARYLSMARCRRCSCAFAMGDSFGAYYHTGLVRLPFVLDVMARSTRLPLHVAALGRSQGCRVPRFRPLTLVGAQLPQPLEFVVVCPDGPAPSRYLHFATVHPASALPLVEGGTRHSQPPG